MCLFRLFLIHLDISVPLVHLNSILSFLPCFLFSSLSQIFAGNNQFFFSFVAKTWTILISCTYLLRRGTNNRVDWIISVSHQRTLSLAKILTSLSLQVVDVLFYPIHNFGSPLNVDISKSGRCKIVVFFFHWNCRRNNSL